MGANSQKIFAVTATINCVSVIARPSITVTESSPNGNAVNHRDGVETVPTADAMRRYRQDLAINLIAKYTTITAVAVTATATPATITYSAITAPRGCVNTAPRAATINTTNAAVSAFARTA